MCYLGNTLALVTGIPSDAPLVGYKVVRCTSAGTNWRNSYRRNVNQVTFKPGRTYTAHASPIGDVAGVGFHTFRTYARAVAAARDDSRFDSKSRYAVIRVVVSGTVVVHSDGYRASQLTVQSRKVERVYRRARAIAVNSKQENKNT